MASPTPRTAKKLRELVIKWGRGEYADAHIIEDFTDFTEALELEAAALRERVAWLMKAPEDTCSPHPGCVYCMEAGTPVGRGEVCPKCGDRLPTRTEDTLREQLAAAYKCVWELPVFRALAAQQPESRETVLEERLLMSLRSGFLFESRDEPLNDYGKRLVRVIAFALNNAGGQERIGERNGSEGRKAISANNGTRYGHHAAVEQGENPDHVRPAPDAASVSEHVDLPPESGPATPAEAASQSVLNAYTRCAELAGKESGSLNESADYWQGYRHGRKDAETVILTARDALKGK